MTEFRIRQKFGANFRAKFYRKKLDPCIPAKNIKIKKNVSVHREQIQYPRMRIEKVDIAR